MAKAVFTGFPAYGHLIPTFGITRELVRAGDEIVYYCHPRYKAAIEQAGAHFRDDTCSSRLAESMDRNPSTGNDQQQNPALLLAGSVIMLREMTQQFLKSCTTAIAAFNPSYLLHDSCCPWGKQVARNLGIPAISSVTTLADLIPLPGSGMRYSSEEKTDTWAEAAALLKQHYGIAEEDLQDLFINKEPLNLVYTSSYFQGDFSHIDNSFLFTGPTTIFDRTEAADFPFEFLKGKVCIYISLGTVFNRNLSFFKNCLKAFGDTEYRVVICSGRPVNNNGELGKIPDNCIVRAHVPQLEVIKRCDLFITHGGMNSVNEGLYYKKPLLLVPQSADQFRISRRVEELGAGKSTATPEPDPAEIKTLAESLLVDKVIRQGCVRVSESYKAAGGIPRAVAAINAFKNKTCRSNVI